MPAVESVGNCLAESIPGKAPLVCLRRDRRALLHVRSGKGGWGWGVLRWLLSFEGRKAGIHWSGDEVRPAATGRAWQWGESVVWDLRKGEGAEVTGTG